jgi:hypothetical protein
MKRKLLVAALMAIMLAFIAEDALAQKKDGPPPWAPAHGYRAKTRYVYFPQQNIYYDTQRTVYIYINTGNWEIGARLPKGIKAVTLRESRQVELRMGIDNPQKYNVEHVKKYRDKADLQVAQKRKPKGY